MYKFTYLLKSSLFIVFLCQLFLTLQIFAGDTPSVPETKVYFINLKDGDVVQSPLLIQFGLSSEMGLAPALVDWPDTGHHHLVVDAPTPDFNKAIPSKSKNHIHLSGGQTELTLDLEPGQHTLQLILGDYSHIPHDPPVLSEKLNITVE
jgi:hypothetical protein